MTKKKKKSALGLFLRIAISVGAIAAICWSFRSKFHEAAGILRNEVMWNYFSVAVLFYVIGLVFLALRLQCIFKVHKIRISFNESFYLGLVGLFFNLFLPSAVGGDLVKGYYAWKHSGKKVESMTSVLMDRIMGFFALGIMAMISIALYSHKLNDPKITQLTYLFAGAMLAAVVLICSRRAARALGFFARWIPAGIKTSLKVVYEAVDEFKRHKKKMIQAVLISMAGQCFFITIHYWLARSLHIELNPFVFFIIIPLVNVVSMAPSLGGLGVREAGVIYFFQKFMTPQRALALSLLLDILIYGFSILSGLIFALRGGLKPKELKEMEKIA